MSLDENMPPIIGQKWQGALELGPRKKPHVFTVFILTSI
jgi:hypothetical protein